MQEKFFEIIPPMINEYFIPKLCGWMGHIPEEEFDVISEEGDVNFVSFDIPTVSEPNKTMLYLVVRKLLGHDTPNYPQQIGDCFPINTMVLMSDGSKKKITDVKIGDKVVTPLGNKKKVTNTISKKYNGKLCSLKSKNNETVRATADHKFITTQNNKFRWKTISDINKEDKLFLPILSSRINNLEEIEHKEVSNLPVYCLEVEDDHSFIANGFAVHNCVSFGAKNALEKLECIEIVQGGEREEFHPIFPPFFYGTGRVFVGKAELGPNEDGSSGSWMAAAVMKYGALRSDEAGVPTYSGQVARKWGYKPGPPANFVDVAKTFLVKSAARLRSFDEVVAAIANGYPVTIASNQGFNMMPSSTGFHEPGREPWPHQMCIIGADTKYKTPYGIIENNWGDSHGRLKDFDDMHDLPIGCLRVRAEIIDRMVKSGEAFAYSAFSGFPSKDDGWLDEALFDII